MTTRPHQPLAVTAGISRLTLLALAILSLALTGCFSERSFPMNPAKIVRLQPDQVVHAGAHLPMRQWTNVAHRTAAPLLPPFEKSALTTDMLATNVYQHFDINPGDLDDVLGNLNGVEQTAQVSSPDPVLDQHRHIQRASWKGFTDVEVPVSGGAILCARLGTPDPRHEIPGSYIVITHGLFGTIDGFDMENHVQALRQAGHHVLAIEMRGHGETACAHPEYIVSFGVQESADLLDVANWLKKTQHATRVGLVSFSITGYEALLTAWLDGTSPETRFSSLPIFSHLPRPAAEPGFNAGMFVVSAPVDLLATAKEFDTRYELIDAPVKFTFQRRVGERLEAVNGRPGYSMWDFVHAEFDRSGWEKDYGSYEILRPQFLRFIDLRADDWAEGARRMENIRSPVLVLAAANDPLATAQSVADLFSRVKNPNIGVIMLPGGGHMGFSALSADYYYSLMTNFFDPATAPGAVPPNSVIVTAQRNASPLPTP